MMLITAPGLAEAASSNPNPRRGLHKVKARAAQLCGGIQHRHRPAISFPHRAGEGRAWPLLKALRRQLLWWCF